MIKYLKPGDLIEKLVDAGLAPKAVTKVEIVDDYNGRHPVLITYTCLVTDEVIEALNVPRKDD
jgi:hypothetical protein